MHFSSPVSFFSVMLVAVSAKNGWETSSVSSVVPYGPVSTVSSSSEAWPYPQSSSQPQPYGHPTSSLPPSSYPVPSSSASGWPSSWPAYPSLSTPVGPASVSSVPSAPPYPTTTGWSTSGAAKPTGAYPHGTGALTTSAITTTHHGGYPSASSSIVPAPVNAGVRDSASMMGLGLVLAAGALMAM